MFPNVKTFALAHSELYGGTLSLLQSKEGLLQAAIILTYAFGQTANEIVRTTESTCLWVTVKFACTVVRVFWSECLREATVMNIEKLFLTGETRN